MSGDALPGRDFSPPIVAIESATPLQISEIVSARIGGGDVAGQIEQAALPQVQLRKIDPSTAPAPIFDPLPGETKAPGFLARLTSFLLPSGSLPETSLVRFAQKPDHLANSSAENLSSAIDRLEKSQQFATGTTLVSALTQSVMSSSKRLTQGQ